MQDSDESTSPEPVDDPGGRRSRAGITALRAPVAAGGEPLWAASPARSSSVRASPSGCW